MKKILAAVLAVGLMAACGTTAKLTLKAKDQVIAQCPGNQYILRDGYNLEGTSEDSFEVVVLKLKSGEKVVTLYFKDEEIVGAVLHMFNDKSVTRDELMNFYPDLCALAGRQV